MDCRKMGPKVFILLLLAFSRLSADVFIWDVGGVLCGCDYRQQLFRSYSVLERVRGYCSILTLLVPFKVQHPCTNFNEYFKDCYLQELKQLPYQSKTNYEIFSDDGITPLPALLKDLMLGEISYTQAHNVWTTSAHANILNKVFEFNFNPERFAAALTLLPAADLLRQCAQQVNADGSKKHCCIILSNMDAAVAPLLKEKFATEITPYIDYWIFSGEVHCAKPDKSIYDLCLNYINTLPKHMRQKIYFVDDQEVNRTVAQTCIPGIVCMHPDDAFGVLCNDGYW